MKIQAQIIVGLVVTLILASGISAFGLHYVDLRQRAAQGALDAEKVKTTGEILKDGSAATKERESVDEGVARASANYDQGLQEALDNDPELRDRDARPVPQRVLDLARERRIERERSVGPSRDAEEGNAKEDVAKR